MDLDADKLKRPMSQKQSDRYSARDRSDMGNAMLCDSQSSVLRIEESIGINEAITPDILSTKNKDAGLLNAKQIVDQKRTSYNRGAFQQNDPNKLLADFPPQLSESSISKRRQSLNS